MRLPIGSFESSPQVDRLDPLESRTAAPRHVAVDHTAQIVGTGADGAS